MLKTEVEFMLPCGFCDDTGILHREGVMRRATAADEILPLQDPRVVKNPGYVVIILLSRVVSRLGSLPQINPKVIESLYVTDLKHLQDLYNRVNDLESPERTIVCPHCEREFMQEDNEPGGSLATPLMSSTGR